MATVTQHPDISPDIEALKARVSDLEDMIADLRARLAFRSVAEEAARIQAGWYGTPAVSASRRLSLVSR